MATRQTRPGAGRGEVVTVGAIFDEGARGAAELAQAHAASGGELGDISTTDELSEEEQFFAAIGEADSTSKVFVYKQMPGAREAKVWSGGPGDFDLHRIALNFGSGEYRVKMYSPSERGNLVVRMNKVLTELLTPEEERDLERRRNGSPAESGGALTRQDVAELIAQTMRAAVPVAPPADPFAQMKQMAEIMRTMQPAPAAPSLDSLALIRGIAGIMRDVGGERDPVERGVNAGPWDLLMKHADKVIPIILNAAGQQQPGALAALPAPDAATAATPSPLPVADASSSEDDPMFMLKMGIRSLVAQAKRNADPALYADLVIDQVPPEDLSNLLAQPDFIAVLAQFVPEVTQHREWFTRLKAEIVEATKPEAAS